MHESWFSYNLARPYPYRWFTWVVGLGGVIAIVLFSVLNLAANGYTLDVVYTTDPNGTLAENQWFQKAPWTLMAKVEASCQSQGLALTTQLFTTQLGLTYQLANVWSYADDGNVIISPSLTYLNNTLNNCSVNNILIDARNSNSVGNSPYWAWKATTISAVATCSVYNGDAHSYFNMTVQFEARPVTESAYDKGAIGVSLQSTGFLHLDQKSKACLWWGQQLLYMWYYNVLSVLGNYASDEDSTTSNTISYMRLYMLPTGKEDITNYDFFNITGWFYMGDGGLHSMQDGTQYGVPLSPVLYDADVGFQMHHFATVFYSTILADLGQPNGSNVLTDTDLIQQYILAGWDNFALTGSDPSMSEQQLLDQLKATSGPLFIKPSTFNSQYICQVPRRRAIGSVFIAVLVADIVFLQALFSVLTWTTTWWLDHTDHESNFCEGCKKYLSSENPEAHAEGISLLPISPKQNSSTTTGRVGKTSAAHVSSQLVTPESPSEGAFRIPKKPVLSWQYERVGELTERSSLVEATRAM